MTNVELINVTMGDGDVVFEKGPLVVGDAGKPDDGPVPVAPGPVVQTDQCGESVNVITERVMVL